MDLEFCKQWLKIDDDADDNVVQLVYDAAQEYVRAAVGDDVNTDSPRCRIVILNIMATLYESREFTPEKVSEKTQYTINSLLRQLWVEQIDIENTDGQEESG